MTRDEKIVAAELAEKEAYRAMDEASRAWDEAGLAWVKAGRAREEALANAVDD